MAIVVRFVINWIVSRWFPEAAREEDGVILTLKKNDNGFQRVSLGAMVTVQADSTESPYKQSSKLTASYPWTAAGGPQLLQLHPRLYNRGKFWCDLTAPHPSGKTIRTLVQLKAFSENQEGQCQAVKILRVY